MVEICRESLPASFRESPHIILVKRKPAALQRRKKNKSSGRVGIAAERAKVASKITIQENGDVDKATVKPAGKKLLKRKTQKTKKVQSADQTLNTIHISEGAICRSNIEDHTHFRRCNLQIKH